MGEIKDKQNKKEQLLEYFFKTIEINPQNETAYILILDRYEQMGYIRKEFYDLCTQFSKKNRYPADASFEMAYSLDPQRFYPALKYNKKFLNSTFFVDIYNNIGNIYFQLKYLEEAENYFLKTLQQDPNDLQFNKNLNIVAEYSKLVNEGFYPFEYNSDQKDDNNDEDGVQNQEEEQEQQEEEEKDQEINQENNKKT
ncbi:tetratricopeptide repeat protein (macronuclear) [Tetrahymena thermophila SB210]|uniref:Tetratricopeptide repeat protein n=1 Tax=Tetrahymena thermophila (strain SB210) TaxID=312017 RepID=Q228L7_TETTS|nr:tetratricopeptide repeat protein [Tetrahymena thermophila SB210]EAR81733.1 tetratricopeptide repeat protein [Tetrahymena thermophila SB210]|eukprot:XP_001029396.1 tetratricopeptide repeat protein [Tetrahymena thermophila SB210]